MRTDKLLQILPSHIGRNPILNSKGEVIAYIADDKPGSSIGWLYLNNDGKGWVASYGTEGDFLCLNPESKTPPYNNACAFGDTPNEALQNLYDWCVNNNFIKE